MVDPDGGVTGVTWEWDRSQLNPPFTDDDDITDPMSDTYTPTNADTSFFLRVTATYMDAKNDAEDTDDRTAVATAPYAVLEVLDEKQEPVFPQADIEVEVAENSPSTTYVGEAIDEAVDPDKGTTLTYSLVGDDAALFDLVPDTRQIVVARPLPNDEDPPDMWYKVDLNHEDKNSYTVMLKASDGALSDTLMVTITVTNRNEAPSTPMEGTGEAPTPDANNAPVFPDTETGMRSVAENTAMGMPTSAPRSWPRTRTPDDTLTYTLGGADMASFDHQTCATGQLMTKDGHWTSKCRGTPIRPTPTTVTVTASDGNTADEAMVDGDHHRHRRGRACRMRRRHRRQRDDRARLR